jgi:hypothetical protein
MLSARTRLGIAWYFYFCLLPILRRCGAKARLRPRAHDLDLLLFSNHRCMRITRFTAEEIHQLAYDLRINVDQSITGNWRFTPLHRLALALIFLSNSLPSRKHQLQTGWAANAILNNARYCPSHGK